MRAWAWQMTCVYAHLQDPVHFSQRDHEIVGASDCRRRVTDSGDAHAPALLLRLGDNLEERMSRMCGRDGGGGGGRDSKFNTSITSSIRVGS